MEMVALQKTKQETLEVAKSNYPPENFMHQEEIQLIYATFQSQVDEIRIKQKLEFQQFVSNLQEKAELKDHSQVENNQLELKDQSQVKNNQLEQMDNQLEPKNDSQNIQQSLQTSHSINEQSSEVTKDNDIKLDPKATSLINELTQMGFTEEQAQCALYLGKNKLVRIF